MRILQKQFVFESVNILYENYRFNVFLIIYSNKNRCGRQMHICATRIQSNYTRLDMIKPSQIVSNPAVILIKRFTYTIRYCSSINSSSTVNIAVCYLLLDIYLHWDTQYPIHLPIKLAQRAYHCYAPYRTAWTHRSSDVSRTPRCCPFPLCRHPFASHCCG